MGKNLEILRPIQSESDEMDDEELDLDEKSFSKESFKSYKETL